MQSSPKEFYWTNPNGNNIYAVEWPADNARAVIGLIHGLGEHCRRYDHMAAWFQNQGIATVGYDRQGFGRSDGPKGHTDSLDEYLDEVSHLTVECERRYPDTPVFLYGHSMGGQLLLSYLIRRHPHISGAVVSAPSVRLSFKPSAFLVGLGKVMRMIKPSFSQPSDLDLNMLSRTPEVKVDYAADPYVHPLVSSKMGIDLLEEGEWLNTWKGSISVPTLLHHGTADGIAAHGGTKDFAFRNPGNSTFKSWNGLFHELHNEPEQKEVFAFVLSWLEEHMEVVHRPPESV